MDTTIPGSRSTSSTSSAEAPEEFLVAPQWCLDKKQVLATIHSALEARDTYQGRLFDLGATDGY